MNRTYQECRGIVTYPSEDRIIEMEIPTEIVRTPQPRSRESALVKKADKIVVLAASGIAETNYRA